MYDAQATRTEKLIYNDVPKTNVPVNILTGDTQPRVIQNVEGLENVYTENLDDTSFMFASRNRNDLPLELQQYGFNVAKLNYKDKSEGIFQHVVVADFDKNTGKWTAKFLIQGCYFNNRSQPTFTIPGLAGWTTISGGTDVECRGGDEVEYS